MIKPKSSVRKAKVSRKGTIAARAAAKKAMATRASKYDGKGKFAGKAFYEMTENENLCRRVKMGDDKYVRSGKCTGNRKVVQRDPSTGRFLKKDDSIIFTKKNKRIRKYVKRKVKAA
jgi:hypothetical protein